MENKTLAAAKQQWRIYQNYIIIGLLSAISVFFLPMLGSSVGMGFILPNTIAGWVVYLTTKICIIIINILIFDQFIKQAKVNIKDDPKYLAAEEILLIDIDDKEQEIIPTKLRISRMYRNKMITTILFTILGVFGFTNAILTFDWVQMLSYTFTIGFGVVSGWITMNEAEIIWTEDHLRYAKFVEQQREATKQSAAAAPLVEKVVEETHIQPLNDSAGTTG